MLAVRGPRRAILLDRGQIVADGPPDQILTGEEARSAYGVPLVVIRNPDAIVPA